MKKSMVEKRVKIKNYLKKQRTDTLHFGNEEHQIIKIKYNKNLKHLIHMILELSDVYDSYNTDGDYETDRGRMRSSIDIWRHIKQVFPKINIFTVMETLYAMRNDLYYGYCSTVERTVFESGCTHLDYDDFFTREYSIRFSDWACLH
jgi:hypothetical protein